ncbi:MAG: ATP-binding cassette domain-containing protein, partial [Oscillochloris sp.]|nr:ATP-binding cassette domain-containing protein [Oscillochloris sp.]
LLVALSIMLYGLVGTAVHLPLLLFWSLQLGTLSEQLARLGFTYVGEVSKGERYLALTKLPCEAAHAADAPAPTPPTGVAVMLDGVAVEQDGLPILKEIRLTIAPGSHVAIVGPSGAGKSTLVGLLLGRSRPACGSLSVDGVPLTESALATLRAQTAWVDPAVQIWNRSFLSNITYGSGLAAPRTAVDLIAAGLIEQLPHGMQSNLGERGRLVSGGQGQRVRYGRAVQHQGARLVILDEPFRGLDREQRRTLLAHARACWTGATLLYVTHDIAHTTDFDRVLVLADGQLVEDGAPADLMGRAGSCYTTLLADDQAVDTRIWAGRDIPWRRVMLSEGQLEATAPAPSLCPDSPAPSPTVPAPTIQAGSELLWEEARLPELLAWLVRHAFGKQDLLDRADSHHNAASLPIDQQIASLTGRYGLEVEPFALRADALAMSLDHAGPALLRLADGRWIALSVGGRRWLHVIAANGTWRRISFARLQSIMHAAHKPPNREAVAHMLLPLALDERQEEIAARALFEGDRRTAKLAEGWSLRLGAEAPLWAQLRRAKIPQALLLAAVAEALLSLLFVLGIGGAGLLAAHGLVIWPWMGALALCVISSIPIDLWKRHYQLAVSMRLRTLLKRRLHAGVIRLMPGDIQQYGIGQFLSWLMEAERLESVASAGPLLLTTSVALLICVALLSGGVVGGLLAPLLLSWLGATALLSWRAYHAYRAQRSCHIETSRDTLERLDGHLTRLAQENPAHWHNEEDAALAGYLALSQRDDHYRSALATLVPYGWLLLALAALAPTLIANTGDTLRLGISLFGISWAFQLLRSLAPTIIDLLRVVGAWQLLSPIEQAARRC